jgi:hypothetical protein
MRLLPRLLAGLLVAPSANHVISAREDEIAKTRARDRAGSANAVAAGGFATRGRRIEDADLGKSGRCGQGEERRRCKQSD